MGCAATVISPGTEIREPGMLGSTFPDSIQVRLDVRHSATSACIRADPRRAARQHGPAE
jgi:hypothetical protein